MPIDINIYNSTKTKYLPKKTLAQLAEKVLISNKQKSASINIVLATDKQVLELNKKYLNHNYFTDVITFSLDEENIEGEIYISVDTARKQADEHKVSLRNELERLAVHGVLHLLGFNDKTAEGKKQMTKLENKYLGLSK